MAIGSEDFKNAILAKAQTGVGRLGINTKSTLGGERYDHVTITFINVPEEQGRGGGGAVAMNNRLLMFVEGFGKGFNEPPPKGKVKFEVGAAELLYGTDMKRPRGKTASPEKMVDYVVKIIDKAAKLPPKLPPGTQMNPSKSTKALKNKLLR